MKNTFNIQFYARESKKDKNGLCHLELSVNANQKRVFVNLPFIVQPSKFNAKRRPKEYEDYIALMRTRVNEILVEMLAHGEPITSERIRDYVKTGGYKSWTIQDMFDEYIAIVNRRNITRCVQRKYELVAEMFKSKFDTSLEVNSLTNAMVIQFKELLLEKYDNNTAVGYLTKFKSFVTYAINNGHLKTNPAAYVKISKESKPIDYLTDTEVDKLKDARLENKSLQAVLDLFLVQAATGMSYCDVQSITKDDIKEDNGIYYITKKRIKTGTEFTAVILSFGVEVLKRNNFELKKISNQKMNSYLKAIAVLVGIDKRLHSHIGRHTYLTYLLNKGIRLEVVSKAAGHKNTKITQQFYAKLEKDTVISEVASAIR